MGKAGKGANKPGAIAEKAGKTKELAKADTKLAKTAAQSGKGSFPDGDLGSKKNFKDNLKQTGKTHEMPRFSDADLLLGQPATFDYKRDHKGK